MIAPEPFFEPRGTPISVYQRIEALSGLGHQVDLLTYHLGKDVFFPNVRILRVRNIGFIKHVRVGPSRAKILLDVLLIFKAFWMLLWNHYDVIHSHEEAAFFCAPLAMIFRKRHVYDMHSVLSRQLGNFNFGNHRVLIKLFALLEKWVLRTCGAVIMVASDLEEYVHQVNPRVRKILIENIALQAFQTPVRKEAIEALKEQVNLDGKVLVVYTGNYERYQGLDMVLKSARLVREQIPSVVFLFVGAKHKQAWFWARKAQEMGVDDCTIFLNAVSPEESMVYLASAEVLISPRISGSTTPLKIYSYLHAGKPIVATKIGAHTQVLNTNTAYLVEPDEEAFAEGITTILRHPEMGEILGSNAHDFARKNFSYESYRAKVDQIYRYLEGYPETETPVNIPEN
ncbi:MAG TPA: glycosyltransferase family 4 protein [Anaerolineales bacterium]|nr:glycosyltransferase family 4 protein [Anaerolineales bacterium]